MASPITIQLDGDASGLRKTLASTEKRLSAFGTNAGKALKAVGIAAAGGIAVAGVGATKLAFDLDSARSEVAKATGATGDELAALTDSLTDAFGHVPDSLDTVAGVLGDVRTRFAGSTEDIEALTVSILDFARVTGGDAGATAEGLGRAFQMWDTDAASADLDVLTRVTQDFGITGDALASQLQTFGPLFSNAGLSMDETATIMGRLHGSGQDISRIGPALNSFFRNAAQAGEDAIPALRDVEAQIRDAGSSSEALAIATDAFGAEGAQRLTAAIRDAGVSFGDLDGFIQGSEGNLERTTEATATFGERFAEIGNRIKGAIAEKVLPVFDRLAEFISDNWDDWAASLSNMWNKVKDLAAAVADVLQPPLEAVWNTIKDVAAALADKLQPPLEAFWEKVKELAPIVRDKLVAGLKDLWTTVKEVAAALADKLQPPLEAFWEKVKELAPIVRDKLVAGLKDLWTTVKEVAAALADKLQPPLEAFKDALESVVEKVVEFVRNNPAPVLAALGTVIGVAFVAKVVAATVAVAAKAAAWWAVASAVIAANAPIYLAVAALGALVGAVVWAYQNVGWFRDAVDAVADFFVEKVWPTLQETAAVVKDVFEQVIWPVVEAVTGQVIDAVAAVPDFLTEKVWPALQETAAVVKDVFEQVIWPVIEAVAGFVIDQVQAVIDIFDGLIDFFTGVFTGDWDRSWQAIKQIFAAVFDFFISAPADLMGKLGEILADIGPTLLGFGGDFVALIGEGVLAGLRFIVIDMPAKMTGWLVDIAANLLKWGGDAMVHIGKGILAGLKFLVLDLPARLNEWLLDIVSDLVSWGADIAASVIDGIIDGISGAASAVFRALRDMISAAWDQVKDVPVVGDVAGVITGGVSAIGGAIGGLFGGARGALVTQPTLALIGEAGPEAVVPLDRAPGAMPLPAASTAALTVNVHIHGDFHGDEDRFAELVVDGLRTYVRRNGPLDLAVG